jgi:hypothetical protein
LALDWPQHGAWITLALDVAGRHDLARRHNAFHISVLRREDRPGKPLGSLPSACYTNRVEALPHVIVDTEAAAWMLWAVWNHSRLLSPENQAEYVSAVWPAVDLAGTFLARWADPRTGAPLHSFRSSMLRDGQDEALLLATYMGVDRASRMASVLGENRAEWHSRLEELGPLVRYRSFAEDDAWKLAHPMAIWLTGLLDSDDRRWRDALQQELESLESSPDLQTAQTLSRIGLYLLDHPRDVGTSRRYYLPALHRVMPDGTRAHPARFPDALQAALCFVAAMTFFEAQASL